MAIISPDLQNEIIKLAQDLATRFTQPEFIPGCQVKDIADIDLYATNNGWIEAICGQHNQQRVRWKSSETVAVNDYIDVLYFADRRLFEAWGIGGSTAVTPEGASVWPLPDKLNIGATEYATLTLALAALGAGDNLIAGEGTYTIDDGSITTAGQLIGSGRGATFLQNASAAAGYVLRINLNGNYALQDLTFNPSDTTIDALNINNAGLNLQLTNVNIFVDSDTAALGVTKCINLVTGATLKLFNCWLAATGTAGGGRTWHTLYVQGGTTIVNAACLIDGPMLAAAGASIILDGCTWLNAAANAGAGTITGHYYDASGNHISLDTTGKTSGVWQIDESALLKIKRATLAAAITAAASGDSIKLDTDTYSVAASQNIGVSVTIEGDGPEATIYTTSVSNATVFDITADSITVVFRNLTIRHTGGGVAATGIFSNNASVTVILDNCVLEISSGSPTTGRGLWVEAGTWILRNGSKVIVSSGTSQYGIYNDSAAATITIGPGCEVGGTTADIYGDQTGSTLANFGLLTNGKVDFAGAYARANIQVTPTEPILMNGHPLVWQHGTSFAAAASGTFVADRFAYHKTGAMVHTLSQSSDVPTVATIGCKLNYSILADCTTIDGSIAAGDFATLRTAIEGYNFLKIAQQQFTLPFWVKATKTGVYCVSFRNSGADRSYVVEYTVNVTDTWEYKQVTVSASPSAGTWDYTNGVGIYVSWALAAGTDFQTTAGAWQTGNFIATSNQVNACDDAANNFRLVVGDPLPGAYARPIVPIPYGDYGSLLARCQRYYAELDFLGFGGTWLNTTTVLLYATLPVEMRAAPTATLLDTSPVVLGLSPTTGAVGSFTGSSSAIVATGYATKSIALQINGFTGATAGQFASVSGAQIGTNWVGVSAEI